MRELLDFDRRYGTDTGGEIAVELLAHDPEVAPQAVSYEATDPDAFKLMLGVLPIEPAGHSFLDLGSGKGRAVFLAARSGFGRVVGVEASTPLHRIACQNLRAWARAGQDTSGIELRNGDAGDCELPDTPFVLYLFNPFRARTLSRVLLQVKWSLQRSPRDVWVVYYNPQFGFMLESAPYLAKATAGRGIGQGDYAVWRSHGEYASPGC